MGPQSAEGPPKRCRWGCRGSRPRRTRDAARGSRGTTQRYDDHRAGRRENAQTRCRRVFGVPRGDRRRTVGPAGRARQGAASAHSTVEPLANPNHPTSARSSEVVIAWRAHKMGPPFTLMTTRPEEEARIPRPSLGWCQIGVDRGPALPRAQLRTRRATTSLWIQGFYIYATAYVLVNIALFALNVTWAGRGVSTGRY
jgi:hypothetical protein